MPKEWNQCGMFCKNNAIKVANGNVQRVEVFLKNWHVSFIGPYCPTSLQQDKDFYI